MSTDDSNAWHEFLCEDAELQCRRLARIQYIKEKLDGVLLGAELEKSIEYGDGSIKPVFACITPDLLSEGVRVTEYDHNGLIGHHCFRNVDDALADCVTGGFRKLASVSFDVIALSRSFQDGCRRIDAIHRGVSVDS